MLLGQDFATFDRYALFVEQISQNVTAPAINFNNDIFRQLQQCRPNHTLLPSLRILELSHQDSLQEFLVTPFLSMRLQSVVLRFKNRLNDDVLLDLANVSPDITSLTVIGDLAPAIFLPLRRFRKLLSLYLDFGEFNYSSQFPKNSFWIVSHALEELPCLESLSLTIPSGLLPLGDPAKRRGIRTLNLSAPANEMMRQLSLYSSLIEVSLFFTDRRAIPSSKIKACCAHLECTSKSSLQSFSLACIPASSIFVGFAPLLNAHSMRSFALNAWEFPFVQRRSVRPQLTDVEVSKMVNAWPLLEELVLTGRSHEFSLLSLSSLARLPYLLHLRLPGVTIPLDPTNHDLKSWQRDLLQQFFSSEQLLGSKVLI